MIHVLVAIALKSLLISGATLALLALMKQRSASERSWVAHLGLLALVIMAFAPLLLPSWNVETPGLFGTSAPATATIAHPVTGASGAIQSSALGAASVVAPKRTIGAGAAASALYAIPAAILLFITFLALGRLMMLRARADVLVDGHWLSALARAQRRMGFKHGTALLTSNELASPVSWGLMRPVILLNSRALEAAGEAEAIIAHELAHVARMDWIKLLLARVATALFWFNPLAWLLAREAHQFREEAADDAVLAADVSETDYAQLLVGVARHECPGLLLGAHGVAPSKSSLARRVARVLDGSTVRAPAPRSFALGVFVGTIAIAAPLAALNLTPQKAALHQQPPARLFGTKYVPADAQSAYYPGSTGDTVRAPTDLGSIIGRGVATTVASAVSAVSGDDFEAVSSSGASVKSANGMIVTTSPSGASVTVYPPDSSGRRKVVARSATGAIATSYAEADDFAIADSRPHGHSSAIEQAIQAKALQITPDYVASMRAVLPKLRDADTEDFVQLKALNITPDYVRELASVGYLNLDPDDLTQARAVGVSAGFVRELKALGFSDVSLSDVVEARAVGITPDFIRRARLAGNDGDLDDFVALRALTPTPPRPPVPPGG